MRFHNVEFLTFFYSIKNILFSEDISENIITYSVDKAKSSIISPADSFINNYSPSNPENDTL